MSRRAQTPETDFIFNGISTLDSLWSLRIVLGMNVRPLSALARFLGSPVACHLHAPMTQTLTAASSPHVLMPFIAAQARYGRLGHSKQRTKAPWIPPRVPGQAERCPVVRPLRDNAVPSSSKQSDPPDGKDETSAVDVERAFKRAFEARWRLAASESLIGRNRLRGPPDSDTCTLARGNGWRGNGLCGDAGEMAFGRRI